MLNKAGEMYQNAYQGAQSRVPEFLRQYPTTMTAPVQMYGALGGVGQEQRALSQAAMDRDMARYEYEAMAPQTALQNYLANISGQYGATSTSQGKGPSSFSSGLMGMMGSGMGKALGGAIPGMLGLG